MFSVIFDELNLIILLIIALFSYRVYNPQQLTIEYQPQGQKMENQNNVVQEEDLLNQVNQDRVNKNQVSVGIQQGQHVSKVQEQIVQILSENIFQAQVQVAQISQSQMKQEIQKSQILEGIEKDQQESTLINKDSNQFLQNVQSEISSTSSTSEISQLSSSQSDIDEDQDDSPSKKQKRKLIQKAKKKAKKLQKISSRSIEQQIQIV